MEKIPSSSDTGSARLDSPSLPKEASKESSAIGELAGMKVTDNTKEKINNFSSLTNDNLKEGSIKRRSLSLQSFVQVGASPATEAPSTVGLSPFTPFSPIIREEPFLLKNIQEKRNFLQEKMRDAVGRRNFTAAEEWRRAAECYLEIIKEKEQSSSNQDAVIELFKSAARYSEIAAEEIERNPTKRDNDIFSLKTVASNLELAAEVLQEGDQELAEAYQNFAASCYYFAVASKPSLVKHLPEALRFGLREESAPNEGACVYWSKAAANNFKKINELLEVRAVKPSGEVEPSASNEASAV